MNNKNVHFCLARVYIFGIWKCTLLYLLIISLLLCVFKARMVLFL